jgi:uncharacterized protein YggE
MKVFSTTGLVVLAVLVVLSVAGGPVFVTQAQQGGLLPTNSITASGAGQASGTPDVAFVSLGVDTVDSNVSEAVSQANATMQRIIAAIQETGVAPEDIQTVSFNVYPEDHFDPQTGESTGERTYRVNNMLSVTVRDIDNVSDVIQAGLNAGATSVNSLSFGIADTTELEQEARTKAVENARNRAQSLADAVGVTLGEPIIISETFGGVPGPVMFDAAAVGMGGAGPQITPGQLTVSVQVNITFAISSES